MTQTQTGGCRVILRMEIRPEAAGSFERTWLEVGRLIAGEPANRGQNLVRSQDEHDVYYVITDWEDEAGFRAFERSDAHVTHRRRLAPFRTGGGMTVTRVVHDLPAQAAPSTEEHHD
ncbi:heme-degrading monooxygenase HmoA [Streptomyces sp. V3I8]|jgi:heme-degrading monooxygenase HmoA|uniref:antibiotic biosynthesis monooxygenase family protein n=1 Tax=Streptomyces sp. V3I8 TaxID=3042279 RepID=UPI0027815B9F|nr:antibiotic biosynthesis monooxygenase family protein [Streptomyces sp. V3I8]MDQ1041666.1 heme-degrading monooxygenase HmoA [Streptomyces sp. V3I8]